MGRHLLNMLNSMPYLMVYPRSREIRVIYHRRSLDHNCGIRESQHTDIGSKAKIIAIRYSRPYSVSVSILITVMRSG